MNESILNVLMYLFENHMEENCNIPLNEEALISELKQAGFDPKVINQALDWLDGLGEFSKIPTLASTTFRILSPEESYHIDVQCWGYLLFLEQSGILDPLSREIVIDRLLNLSERIDLAQLKWVTLMVLFNKTDNREALQTMEQLVLSAGSDKLH